MVSYYRNLKTGELETPHRLGETDDGEAIYCFAEGYCLADANGEPLADEAYDIDEDGNWIVSEPSPGYQEQWSRPVQI